MNIRKIKYVYYPLSLCYCFSIGFAQDTASSFPFRMEARAHYGFIIPHRSGMEQFVKGHVSAFELAVDIPTYGKQRWQQIYNYPSWGVTCYYADLSNPVQLGVIAGVYPYLRFPLIKRKSFSLTYRLGWGIGYVSKTFDRVSNYKNFAIGFHYNPLISNNVELSWILSKRIAFSLGLGMAHVSNGAFKTPNQGLNIPAINAGCTWSVSTKEKKFIRDTIPKIDKKLFAVMYLSGGAKEIYPVEGPKYPAFSFSLNMYRPISHGSIFSAGIDLFYNTSFFSLLSSETGLYTNKLGIVQYGLNLCYTATVGKLWLFINNGVYLHNPVRELGLLYHTIGTRYLLSKRLVANITLKTHFFKADFMELGIGYRFNKP